VNKAYIARQEILDLRGKLIGYELLFRDHPFGINEFPSHLKATSQVVMNVLSNVNVTDIIPNNVKAFINVDETVLLSGIIDILDRKVFVLELLETIELNDKIIKKMKHYYEMGFMIAIDDFDCTAEMITKFTPVLKYVGLVKIDVITSNPKNLKKLIPKFKSMGKQVLVEKVETEDEYNLYQNLEVDFLQGYYISRPEVIEIAIHKEATHMVILQLIGLLKEDAGISIVKKFVRSRPDLSFKLIRYLNNQNDFSLEINSITQVITLMGRDRLMRWLLTYLYSEVATIPISTNVLLIARKRAEAMEYEAPTHMKEKAYLAGMFSMLDLLFETDIKELIRDIKLDKEIVSLVTTGTGRFSDSLKAIEKVEKGDLKKIVCENFDKLRMEDILYAIEYSGVKLPDNDISDDSNIIYLD